MRTVNDPTLQERAAVSRPERGHVRRRSWIWVTAVAAAVVVVGGLLAFGLGRDPNAIRTPLIGRPAPAFSLRTLEGDRTIRLSDLRGQVVVVNFWASWCAPCRQEHPFLAEAWRRYRDQGVVLVGISYQDPPAASRAYIRELGGGWPVVTDPGAKTALAYGVYGIPETFFIGRDGRVAHKTVGPVSYETLTTQISRLLASPP